MEDDFLTSTVVLKQEEKETKVEEMSTSARIGISIIIFIVTMLILCILSPKFVCESSKDGLFRSKRVGPRAFAASLGIAGFYLFIPWLF